MNLPLYRIVEGRRLEGLPPPKAVFTSAIGRYFARSAYHQAASALAFDRLRRELDAYGSPGGLLERCEQARARELMHSALFAELAEQFATPVTMPARAPTECLAVRPLVDVAIDNAVEGVVRSTFGAAVARYRATHAEDPEIRRVMEIIAEDEQVHAELAHDIASWLHDATDASTSIEGILVEDSIRHAARALAQELDMDPDPSLCTQAGIPSRLDALTIWSRLSHRVWHDFAHAAAA
ncbi:hypothetical protein [Labilithrix luteola]|uniref:hypothetical protein n=1 Tax=Labilithrix luteola TaxID=1391654 RepID=UPI0011BADB83|nr:hypothetical protein [Labilithrix luteola]